MYDVIIVGSGMAGVSAALTLQLHKKNILWLGSPELSEKIRKAERIRNYPGLSDISGEAFVETLKNQVAEAGLVITDEMATGVYAMGDKFTVLTEKGSYDGLTVVVTTGVESAKSVAGEEKFVGRGVSYCATCDGFLYKGKTIAVVATSEEKEGEVEYLASLAEKVYFFPQYKNVGVNLPNVEIITEKPKEIAGVRRVEKLLTETREFAVECVFFLKNAMAPSVLVGGIKAEGGHVVVNRDMSTNLKGCFAAGDCTGAPYQYAKAAGEGNVAAHSVVGYLRELSLKKRAEEAAKKNEQ
ncbi:MAG: NAD(P)/FAD-dependent oxidoreductase [Clostridia bacterium]|nr:NAD(P)/FAD-dependent oxidoreductase [Clostridia bacterium]